MLITVFGRRGSGKTTLIRRIIPKLKKPVIVLDILGNYDTTQNELGFDADVSQDLIGGLESLKAWHDRPDNHPGVVVVMGSDISRSADYFSSALWQTGGGTLVLDEIDAIDLVEAPCFDEAVRYGRNRGIDIITGCRRPAEISKNITAGADLAYCLSTHEPRDIQYYREFLGDTLAFQLPQLPPYHGVYKDFKQQREGLFKTTDTGDIKILKSRPAATGMQIPMEFSPGEPPVESDVDDPGIRVPQDPTPGSSRRKKKVANPKEQIHSDDSVHSKD